MSIPSDRDELRDRWSDGERFSFHFFYGHKPPASGVDDSCFSQWFARPFTIDGISYSTAEHWMMAAKARLFGDEEMLAEILACETPKEAKAFGRKVQGFDADTWNQHKFEIVRIGNYEKFSQHPDLRDYLLGTGSEPVSKDQPRESGSVVREKPPGYQTSGAAPVILVEAAGRDVIWGIGLGKSNPKSQNPQTWRGRNLLGFALTIVRDQIASQDDEQ